MTKKRVTVMIDYDLDRKLRLLQAKQIIKSNGIVNFSDVLNQDVRKGLKK